MTAVMLGAGLSTLARATWTTYETRVSNGDKLAMLN